MNIFIFDDNKINLSRQVKDFLVNAVPAAVVIMAVVLALVLAKKRKNNVYSSKTIAYAGVCIALATALNFFTLFQMPQGGSVTLGRLVPLLIYAYCFRKEKGFLAGAIYGLIDFIAKPYFVNIFQFLLDYIFAFSCVGFAGIISLKLKHFGLIIGAAVAGIARFVFSTVSGVLFFAAYAPEDMSVLEYSLGYNSFLLVDMAICIAVISLLMFSETFRKLLEKNMAVKPLNKEKVTADTDSV